MTATEPPELLPTRRSLLSKLKSWENQDSWRDFFNTYWKLIFDVAKKSGLDEAEAQEAVQETVISVAKEMKGFQYDPAKGGFKRWLLTIARRRILDQMRKRYRNRTANTLNPADTSVDAEISLASEESITNRLDQFPESVGLVDPSYPKHPGLRVTQVDGFPNHLVYYVPTPTGIRVLRLLPAARDADAVFG